MAEKKSGISPGDAQNELEVMSQTVVNSSEDVELKLVMLENLILFPGNTVPLLSLRGIAPEGTVTNRTLIRVGVLAIPEGMTVQAVLNGKADSLIGVEAFVTGGGRTINGGFSTVLKGLRRFRVKEILKSDQGYVARASFFPESSLRRTNKLLASLAALKTLIGRVLKMNSMISEDVVAMLQTTDDVGLLCDLIAPHLQINAQEKFELISELDVRVRLKLLLKYLAREVDLLGVAIKIQENVRGDLQESLRRSFLKEQMTAIKRELGEGEAGDIDELEELQQAISALALPERVSDAAKQELSRLESMAPGSPEYMVSWSYLGWLKDLPWSKSVTEHFELYQAERCLDRHHYGLKEVKDRILEHIAIVKHQHNKTVKGQILLLVGPPGVGKTSLVSSIAKAMKRPFARISLGGVKDEAEIRGHRRTYIGAMPGKLIQAMKEAGASNPIILIDEVDKTSGSVNGDIASALLEVLDPEQNSTFTDHYLGLPFDLSEVMFIATANSTQGISAPLFDRMDVVEVSGYSEKEKIRIARAHIIPAVRKELSLSANLFQLNERILKVIVNHYTRESGVRQLRRVITQIGRKIVRRVVEKGRRPVQINQQRLVEMLGMPQYLSEPQHTHLPCGVSIGLAYTSFGGDILYIESRKVASSGPSNLQLTGSLGKVMQESAQTALSYLMSNLTELEIPESAVKNGQIHLHLPDGATPKDGPSAGVAILAAFLSLLKKQELPTTLAMTGEITLRGHVLPVGGIKEKLLAAHRYGKKDIILPAANWFDLQEVPEEVLGKLNLYPVSHHREALVVAGLLSAKSVKRKPKPRKFSKELYLRRLNSSKTWAREGLLAWSGNPDS